jgi:para-nitrobenzyl esterase
MTSQAPRAKTSYGTLLGSREGALNVFRGVRYAKPPLGPLRFKKPVELALSDAEMDATKNGPISPQMPARVEFAMGPFEAEQGEDCLTVTVWAPADLGSEKVPVLVWFHGGAFNTGAASIPWYSGAPLAREGRIVVVGVNSRLGALGYMRMPGVSPGNLGLHDQLASLHWVQKSIAGFGGDPAQVTIMGQSAGAYAGLALILNKTAKPLFKRAILQSGPYAKLPEAAERAEAKALALAKAIGVPPTAEAMEKVSVADIFKAGGEVARQFVSLPTQAMLPPFAPCADGGLLAAPLLDLVAKGEAAWCDIVVGYTREESAVFAPIDPRVANLTVEQTRDVLEPLFGGKTQAAMDEYIGLRGFRGSASLIHDVLTDTQFVVPSIELAKLQEKAGRPAFVYQFDWQSPQTDLGSNHCLELPFLLGEPAAWATSPMFVGAREHDYKHIGHAMRSYWIAFTKTGDPNSAGLPPWQAYQDAGRTTLRFDRYIAPISDLAGSRWRAVFAGK